MPTKQMFKVNKTKFYDRWYRALCVTINVKFRANCSKEKEYLRINKKRCIAFCCCLRCSKLLVHIWKVPQYCQSHGNVNLSFHTNSFHIRIINYFSQKHFYNFWKTFLNLFHKKRVCLSVLAFSVFGCTKTRSQHKYNIPPS